MDSDTTLMPDDSNQMPGDRRGGTQTRGWRGEEVPKVETPEESSAGNTEGNDISVDLDGILREFDVQHDRVGSVDNTLEDDRSSTGASNGSEEAEEVHQHAHLDLGPVKNMERDLYRDAWYADDCPGFGVEAIRTFFNDVDTGSGRGVARS